VWRCSPREELTRAAQSAGEARAVISCRFGRGGKQLSSYLLVVKRERPQSRSGRQARKNAGRVFKVEEDLEHVKTRIKEGNIGCSLREESNEGKKKKKTEPWVSLRRRQQGLIKAGKKKVGGESLDNGKKAPCLDEKLYIRAEKKGGRGGLVGLGGRKSRLSNFSRGA